MESNVGGDGDRLGRFASDGKLCYKKGKIDQFKILLGHLGLNFEWFSLVNRIRYREKI